MKLRHIRLHYIQQFFVYHKPVYLRIGRAWAAMLILFQIQSLNLDLSLFRQLSDYTFR